VTVAYRASNSTASNVTPLADGVQITLAAPTGTVVGDLLVLTVTADGVPSTPSGWTLAGSGTTVGGPGLKVFYKIATSTEVSSGVTFRDVGGNTDSVLGCLSGYTGADTTTPVTVSYGGSATASTSHVAPTLTPTVAGSYLHVAYTCRGGTFTHTTVAGMTEIADISDSWLNLAVDNQSLSDTSATGTKTATSSTSATYDSVSVLINAAPLATGKPAVVQQVTGSTTSSANFTTSAVTTTAGNVLLLIAGRSGGLGTGSLTSVTDPVGNTWSKITTGSINGGTNTRVEVWYTTQNVGALTSQAITANSATSQSNDYSIIELSGVDRTAPVVASSPDGSGETSATPTTPAVTAGLNDLVLSVIHHAYNAAADTVSTAGWTLLTPSVNGTTHLTSAAYQVESAAGSYGPTWSRGGAVSSGTGEITVSLKAATSVTYATETWTGTTGAAWPAQWTRYAGATGSGSTIQSNAGRTSIPTVAGYATGDMMVLTGMTAAADVDLTATVTFSTIQEEYLHLMVRSNATGTFSSGIGLNIYPALGTTTAGFTYWNGGAYTAIGGDLTAGTWTANTPRKVRLQAIGTTIRVKIWDATAAEPATWLGSIDTTQQPQAGKVALTTFSGNTTSGGTVTLDDLTITSAPGVLASEYFPGASGAAWPAQWTTGTASGAVVNQDGAGRGTLTSSAVAYGFANFAYLSGIAAWRDLDVAFDATFPSTAESYLVVELRGAQPTTGGAPSNCYYLQIDPNGVSGATVDLGKTVAGVNTDLTGFTAGPAFTANTAVRFRFQAVANTVQVKWWTPGGTEPTTWGLTVTDSSLSAATGRVAFQNITGAGATAQTARVSNILVSTGQTTSNSNSPNPADSVGLTDAITVVQNENVSLTVNSVGVTDTASATASVSRTAPDTVGLTDTVTRVLTTVRAPADTVGLTDVFNATIYPPLASLVDPFNTADTTKWTFGPNATVANNRVSFATTDTTFSGYLTSVGRYTLIGSRATVRVPTVATSPDNQATTYFALYADNPNGNAVLFNVTGSTLSFLTRIAGVQSTLASLTYDPVAHRWWRFTESIGNVVFQTSPDGVVWTTRATWTPTWDISGVFASVGAGTGASPTGATPAVIDSFNLPATAALTDDFATLDPAKWSVDRPGNASSVAGRLALVADSSFVNLYGTADADLTDSVVSGQLLPMPTVASGTVNFYLGIIDRKTTNNQLWIEVQNNTVSARGWEGSTATVVYSSPDWTALPTGVPSVLLRLRHSSATNTIYFEYSTDGTTWTTFGSRVGVPFDISQVYIDIGAGTVGAPSTPTVLFDNLNLPVFWYQPTAADTVGLTDAAGKGFGRAPADNLGLTDTPSRTVGQAVSPADTVGTHRRRGLGARRLRPGPGRPHRHRHQDLHRRGHPAGQPGRADRRGHRQAGHRADGGRDDRGHRRRGGLRPALRDHHDHRAARHRRPVDRADRRRQPVRHRRAGAGFHSGPGPGDRPAARDHRGRCGHHRADPRGRAVRHRLGVGEHPLDQPARGRPADRHPDQERHRRHPGDDAAQRAGLQRPADLLADRHDLPRLRRRLLGGRLEAPDHAERPQPRDLRRGHGHGALGVEHLLVHAQQRLQRAVRRHRHAAGPRRGRNDRRLVLRLRRRGGGALPRRRRHAVHRPLHRFGGLDLERLRFDGDHRRRGVRGLHRRAGADGEAGLAADPHRRSDRLGRVHRRRSLR
jgi:hypothetical protein